MLAAATFDSTVVIQEKKLAAAGAFEDPFRALDLEVTLHHIAQKNAS